MKKAIALAFLLTACAESTPDTPPYEPPVGSEMLSAYRSYNLGTAEWIEEFAFKQIMQAKEVSEVASGEKLEMTPEQIRMIVKERTQQFVEDIRRQNINVTSMKPLNCEWTKLGRKSLTPGYSREAAKGVSAAYLCDYEQINTCSGRSAKQAVMFKTDGVWRYAAPASEWGRDEPMPTFDQRSKEINRTKC